MNMQALEKQKDVRELEEKRKQHQLMVLQVGQMMFVIKFIINKLTSSPW